MRPITMKPIAGDAESITPIEMPDSTRELLREVLKQNRMILEVNCSVLKSLCLTPMMVVRAEKERSE